MKNIRLIAILGVFLAIPCALSQTTAPVLTVQCIAHVTSCPAGAISLRDGNVGDTPAPFVAAQGYYAPGDGGGGDFYLFAAGAACSADDNGTAITNAFSDDAGDHTNCYHRRFTGTVYMAWFGVKNFDGDTGKDVANYCGTALPNCWTNAFNAAQLSGNNVVSTGGMYLYSTQSVTPNAYQTFTCDAPYTGAQVDSNYSYTGTVKGAILFAHPASIHIGNDSTEFHHCVILSVGSATYPINLNPGLCGTMDADKQRCALDDYENAVANSDVGVICDGPENNYIHDVLVIGFDTGIASFGCSRWKVTGANIDASVGVYWQSNKSPAYVSGVNVFPFLVNGLPVRQKDTAFAVSDISGVGGLCRVSITVSGASNIHDGDWVSLAGDKTVADEGPLSCYGTFKVANTDSSTYVDLEGTTYGDNTAPFMSTPGTWPANSAIITVDSVEGIQAGECVTSSDSSFASFQCPIAGGTGYLSNSVMVKDVSYYSKKIVIDRAIKNSSSTASPPTLSFTNYGPHPIASKSILYLYASSHIDAGYSIGGAAAGNVASCFLAGGPGDSSTLSVIGNSNFCFGHRMQYNFNSTGPAVCTGCGQDNQAELFDIRQIGLRLGHGSDPFILSATPLGSVLGMITLSGGQPFDPRYAGWKKNDTVISSSGGIATITSLNATTVTLSATISGTTFYDVKPPTLTGNTSSGSPTITGLSGNPHDPSASTQWNVGDVVVAPVSGDIPAGAQIVSYTSSSVTLNMNATGSHSATPIDNVSVRTPQNTAGADIVGSTLGGGGGMVFDSGATGCNSVQGISMNPSNPGQPSVEVVQGCMTLTDISEAQANDLMIDFGAKAVLMSHARTGPSGLGSVYFEGDQAAQAFAGAANFIGGGGQSNMMTFGDSSGAVCPPTSRSVVVIFCGGDTLGIAGNTYKSCNPAYAASGAALCLGTFLNGSGVLTRTNSSNNPVFEFNDSTQALLPQPYQDGIQAATVTLAKTLIAAENVVSSCAQITCALNGVLLPASAGWIDATASLANSDCFAAGGNCGVAGSVTVLNAAANSIKVWCTAPDTVSGLPCATGVSISAKSSKTFYPVKGVGWLSN